MKKQTELILFAVDARSPDDDDDNLSLVILNALCAKERESP